MATKTKPIYDPLYKARTVKDDAAAQRLAERIGSSLAGPRGEIDNDYYNDANDALALLEERFENIDTGTSDVDLRTKEARYARGQVKPDRTQTPAARQAARQRASSSSRTRRRRAPGPSSSWYLRQTGIPGAYRSTSAAVLGFIGATIGLSILYLLIAGKGPAGVAIGAGKVSDAFNRLLRPVDPLRPIATQKKQAAAKAAAAKSKSKAKGKGAAGTGLKVKGSPLARPSASSLLNPLNVAKTVAGPLSEFDINSDSITVPTPIPNVTVDIPFP